MDDEQIKKSAEFLINNLAGKDVPGSVKINVRYRTLVDFAKVYGITDPKYIGPEEEGVIACHAFANHFTIKALYKMLLGMKVVQNGEERPFVKNPGKLLHMGQTYNWEDCVDLKSGDKLLITAKWGKVWLIEKNMMLLAEFHVEVRNQDDDLIVKPIVTAGIRPGGY